jgi:cell division protease FtsH
LHDGRSLFIINRVAPEVASRLSKYGVTFSGAEESSRVRDVLSCTLPVLLFFGL